ncbi:hypothetical protein [Geomicrobium sp. JCM 19055]|uniref:hypothetical protein n=1 Tax=Geomicrobium sp. JCM 19055 TaxID=1460649 RepID=UPI00045ED6BB|nr:hypothetical protein [Geomicrobium sp. JCM 19055]GAJ98158.1 hypothetical protein JCM19055_1063 [Geomicrobium sp. JCM 19055]
MPFGYHCQYFFIVVSLVLAILTLQLPHAQLGNPYGPMYFPLVVSVGLFLFFSD